MVTITVLKRLIFDPPRADSMLPQKAYSKLYESTSQNVSQLYIPIKIEVSIATAVQFIDLETNYGCLGVLDNHTTMGAAQNFKRCLTFSIYENTPYSLPNVPSKVIASDLITSHKDIHYLVQRVIDLAHYFKSNKP